MDANSASTLKLKFGIEAILNAENNLSNCEKFLEANCSREATSPTHSDCQSESSMQTNGSTSEAPVIKECFFVTPTENKLSNKKLEQKFFSSDSNESFSKFREGILTKSNLSMRSHRPLQYHPYSPPKASERFFPDQISSMKLQCSRSARGKSESPKSHHFSLRTPGVINAHTGLQTTEEEKIKHINSHTLLQTWKRDRIPSLNNKSISVSPSPIDIHRSNSSRSPTGLVHERRSSDNAFCDRMQNVGVKIRRSSDSDDVFNDVEKSPLASTDISTLWRTKPLSSCGKSSTSSSPGFVTSPDHTSKRSKFSENSTKLPHRSFYRKAKTVTMLTVKHN